MGCAKPSYDLSEAGHITAPSLSYLKTDYLKIKISITIVIFLIKQQKIITIYINQPHLVKKINCTFLLVYKLHTSKKIIGKKPS